jgi:hypothetical protein
MRDVASLGVMRHLPSADAYRWSVEILPEAGAERAIIDSAANLKQEIGPSSRPTYLLGLIHPASRQEIGRPLRGRNADPGPLNDRMANRRRH